MDAFEELVSHILWNEGFWVRTSVKVNLTKEEKRRIGRPSSPRWELDIVAYNARNNDLHVVECKSYLDSQGVSLGCIDPKAKDASRYKLFTDATLRDVVFNRLRLQFEDAGACRPGAKVQLALACGKISNDGNRSAIREHFDSQGWLLSDEFWLRERLKAMANAGYENQVSTVVAKLLLRGSVTSAE